MSAKKSVRKFAFDSLVGSTAVGNNVYPGRSNKLQTSELPALVVFTSNENAEKLDDHYQRYDRTITLTVQGVVQGHQDDVDDAMDNLAEEVEAAVLGSKTLADFAIDVSYSSTAKDFISDAQLPVGMFEVSFEVRVETQRVT